MSFEMETLKRKPENEPVQELTDDDIREVFGDEPDFAQMIIEAKEFLDQNNPKEKENFKSENLVSAPTWKEELQTKISQVSSIEDLDVLTKEIVKKNRPRKLPKKKLVRVENFYQRHISGVAWMNNFIARTKPAAISRPYVERMLEIENKIKKMIEEDDLLGPQLLKDDASN
jgi:hypothetical protein